MKKTFYSVLLLAFTCIMPAQAQATSQDTMPSWEGVYCDKATDNCMRIYEQGVDTVNSGGSYAQIMFFTQESGAFVAEGELSIASPTEGNIFLLHITPSEDRKTMKVVENPYFKSWGDDPIDNYGDSFLFGNYVRVE